MLSLTVVTKDFGGRNQVVRAPHPYNALSRAYRSDDRRIGDMDGGQSRRLGRVRPSSAGLLVRFR